MSYLHCHSCGWGQDDFWTENGYNPITWLYKNCKQDLFKIPNSITLENIEMKSTEYVILELEKTIRVIKNMRYRTYEEFKNENPNGLCPNCGEYLDED